MTSDLESRLISALGDEADRLPGPVTDLGAVVARGDERRTRARAAGVGVTLGVVLAGIGLVVGLLGSLAPAPVATVAADRSAGTLGESAGRVSPGLDDRRGASRQPGSADAAESTDSAVTTEPPTVSIGDPVVASPVDGGGVDGSEGADAADDPPMVSTPLVELPIMTIEPWHGEPPGPTTTAPATTTTTAPPTTTTAPPGGQRSTDDVIASFRDEEILFFSNNDGCRGIAGGQAHPDWIEGQSSSGRNADGTPTYGYAYNTGDAGDGDYTWGFEEDPLALSGECVLSIGLNDAYENKHAVRIFRRYDRHGDSFPSDAYYSAWFYFPEELSYDSRQIIDGRTVFGFWNVFQIKNKVRRSDGSEDSLSALSFNAGKVTGDDHMAFHLWSKTECGVVEECERAGAIEQLGAEPMRIPVGRWVHVELRLVSRTDSSGRIEMWQDGQQIYDYAGITERQGTIRRNWSVNSYGVLHRPASHEIHVDDALISTRPVHPLLFE